MLDNTNPAFLKKYREELSALPPPRLHRIPPKRLNRLVSGGVARTPGGRLWAAFLMNGETAFAKGTLVCSDDDGDSWSEPCFETDASFTPSDAFRVSINCVPWTAPDGRLFFFYDSGLSMYDGLAGIWQTVCENPDAAEPEWSTPERIWHGAAPNKPTVLPDGSWLLGGVLGVYPLDPDKPCVCDHRYDDVRCAHAFRSDNAGESWTRLGGFRVPQELWSFYEPNPVPLNDGGIRMYFRTSKGVAHTDSRDGGISWNPFVFETFPHPPSRIAVARLHSGRLMMIRHRTDAVAPKRECLAAYLSEDDGKSWPFELILDPHFGISYPDFCEGENGTIYAVYDHLREGGAFLLARFREVDILSGNRNGVSTRMIFHLPGYEPDAEDRRIHIKLVGNQ